MTLHNPESLTPAMNTQPVVWEQGTLTHAHLSKVTPLGSHRTGERQHGFNHCQSEVLWLQGWADTSAPSQIPAVLTLTHMLTAMV